MIPGFSIRLGGATSIDVTRPGIDKAYGIKKLKETLGVPIADMIFVGDAIFPGGNDYPAKQAGVESIRVRDPEETKRVVEAICACLETGDSHRRIAQLMIAALSIPRQPIFRPQPSAQKARTAKAGDEMGVLTQKVPDEAGAVVLEHQEKRPLIDAEVERRYP